MAERAGGSESQPGQRTGPEGPAAASEAGVPGGGTGGREEPVGLPPLLPSIRSQPHPFQGWPGRAGPLFQALRNHVTLPCHCHCLERGCPQELPEPREWALGAVRTGGTPLAPATGTAHHPCLHALACNSCPLSKDTCVICPVLHTSSPGTMSPTTHISLLCCSAA